MTVYLEFYSWLTHHKKVRAKLSYFSHLKTKTALAKIIKGYSLARKTLDPERKCRIKLKMFPNI